MCAHVRVCICVSVRGTLHDIQCYAHSHKHEHAVHGHVCVSVCAYQWEIGFLGHSKAYKYNQKFLVDIKSLNGFTFTEIIIQHQ